MNTEQRLETAVSLLVPWSDSTDQPAPNRLDVVIDAKDLLPSVETLLDDGWGYLSAITGLDLGPDTAALEVLYHFCAEAAVLTLRIRIPYDAAAVPSLFHLIPSSGFFERELEEMLGIEVTGLKHPERLFLPDEWPEGVYPLRKSFKPESD